MRKYLTVLVAMLALAGCGDDGGPSIPEFDGRWTGVVSGVDVVINANETDGDISGTDSFQGSGGSLAFSISGVNNHPSVSFTISASGTEDANFDGEFINEDFVSGQLFGSGFNGETMTLDRQ